MKTNFDLETDIGGITLKNPVMTASGTFGYGREFETFADLNRLGGIIVKGLSLALAFFFSKPCSFNKVHNAHRLGFEFFTGFASSLNIFSF